MSRLVELATTVMAGAIGSTFAVLTLGASLMFVVPVTLGVGVIALAADHEPRSRDEKREPQNA